MNSVITFYSYKGGVGRTMSLANIGVLLAQWGYKVLIVDWDLEAPGLEHFYKDYIDINVVKTKSGVIDLLQVTKNRKIKWQDTLIPINVPKSKEPIHLISSGRRDENYFKRVRKFDVDVFYKNGGGKIIEDLRTEWKNNYDFILIDSRTGITEIGGICTIQLPDIIVLLFTATNQGFNGTLDISDRALKAQQKLPYDRQKLVFIPIPTKFDTQTEFILSQDWMNLFSEKLKNIYDDWLPKSVKRRDFLEKTKIPYISYFSFGEKLPVIEQGVKDPTGLGYAYENIAALLANQLDLIEDFISIRDLYVNKIINNYIDVKSNYYNEEKTISVYISYPRKDTVYKDKLLRHLSILSKIYKLRFLSDSDIEAGQEWEPIIKRYIQEADVILLLLSPDYFASGFLEQEIALIFEIYQKEKFVIVPIILRQALSRDLDRFGLSMFQSLPRNRRPISKFENQEEAFFEISNELGKLFARLSESKLDNN